MFNVLDDGVIKSKTTGELYFNIDRIVGEYLRSQNSKDFKKRLERYMERYPERRKACQK